MIEGLNPQDITIAITVYDRPQYIGNAIRSALDQECATSPRTLVVEDCGPKEALQRNIEAEFGSRITYRRNRKRRGLFDNWNACIEACTTPWLCILHDDDFLEPIFIKAMIELENAAPGRALYYGACHVVDASGARKELRKAPNVFQWHELPLADWARHDPVCFPGQLFNVAAARELGGFRAASHYCADWEMWFRLALAHGAVATNRVIANYREHQSRGRGTTRVDLSGRKYALVNAQRKRHFAWLRKSHIEMRFDRLALQSESPLPIRFILRHGQGFSPRMLRYNVGLLSRSASPHLSYSCFQMIVRLFTWRIVQLASRLVGLFHP